MPDNDVASQWKSFDDTKRARLLQKMSPDQKKNLRAALEGKGGASSTTPPPPPPTETPGFFKRAVTAALTPIGNHIAGYNRERDALNRVQDFSATEAGRQAFTKHPIVTGAKSIAAGVERDLADFLNPVSAALALIPGASGAVGEAAPALRPALATASKIATPIVLAGGAALGGKQIYDATTNTKLPYEQRVQEGLAGAAALTGTAAGGLSEYGPGPGALKRSVQRVVVGEQPVEELVNKAKEQNAASLKKAAEDTQKQIEKRQAQVKAVGESRKTARATNEKAAGDVSRREALQRGVEQLDPKFQEDLQGLEKNVRAQAGEKYNAVRGAYDKTVAQVSADAGEGAADALAEKGLVVKPGDLSSDVKRAEGLIRGSDENLKVFRDILSKYPDEDPDFVELNEGGGSTQIPRGHPLYDVLKEDQVEGAQPATFRDLHGYSAELGKTLSRGNLPDDVFRATKALKASIDGRMDTMAKASGAGKQLGEARSFFRDYANAFRDKSSPLYKAMNTTERGQSIAALRGKDQSGIEAIARYDPDLAKRANTIREHQAEAAALPKKTVKAAEPAKLPPKPKPITADIQKVGPDEIRQAKLGALNKNINWVRHRGKWLATGELFWGALNGILNRSPGQVLRSIGVAASSIAGADRLTDFARRPDVQEWLTRPTAQDLQYLERLPPEQRAVTQEALRSILEAGDGRKAGIAPQLAVFVYGSASVPQTAAEAKRQAEAARQTQTSAAPAAQ